MARNLLGSLKEKIPSKLIPEFIPYANILKQQQSLTLQIDSDNYVFKKRNIL